MARASAYRSGLACALVSAAVFAATAPASRTPIELRTGIRPGLQLEAMRTAIKAAPSFYVDFNSGCVQTTPMLSYKNDNVMAGNFRDQDGNCYIWLNLAHAPDLNAREICKLTLHEAGHLTGLQHSSDPDDVMFSPFRSEPTPKPCTKPLPSQASAARRVRRAD